MNFDLKNGGLIGKISTGALMVALEQAHAKMLAVIPAVPLGEMVIVAPGLIAHALGPAMLLNGRLVRVDVHALYDEDREWILLTNGKIVMAPLAKEYSCGVYLVRESDLQENQGLNA